MRRASQAVGVGSLITAMIMGAPGWFLLVLTGAVLFLGILTLTPGQIDAFNRLVRGRSIDAPKPQDPPAREVEDSQQKKLDDQQQQKELPPPRGQKSFKKDKRKRGRGRRK